MREIGYQTVYLNEQLSLGLAPEGLKEYITQRSRWCLGFVQICRGKSGPLRFQNRLTFVDRVILSETFLYWSATHSFRLLALIVPVLFLLFGIQAVHASVQDVLSYFLPCFIVQMSIMGWMTQARVVPIMADVSQLIAAHSVLRAVVAGLLRPVGQKFKVTAKGGNRDVRFVEWSLLKMLLGYLVLTIVAVISAFGWDGGWSLRGIELDRAVLELVQHPDPDIDLFRLYRAAAEAEGRASAKRRPCRRLLEWRNSLASNPRHFDERTADRGTSPC